MNFKKNVISTLCLFSIVVAMFSTNVFAANPATKSTPYGTLKGSITVGPGATYPDSKEITATTTITKPAPYISVSTSVVLYSTGETLGSGSDFGYNETRASDYIETAHYGSNSNAKMTAYGTHEIRNNSNSWVCYTAAVGI